VYFSKLVRRRGHPHSFLTDSIFGEDLGDQFSLTRDNGAPAVLVVCTGVLEQRAKDNGT